MYFRNTAGVCDPRGIGISPVVSKIWSTLPLPNDPSALVSSTTTGYADGINAQGYLSNGLALPQTSNFIVGRLDHDFGDKWKFNSSYRYYSFSQLVSTQVDIGGVLSGATEGSPKSYAPRPVKPSFWSAGLTTTLTANVTNDFHFGFLRNYWLWSTQAGPPQFSGLGGAVEIGGESLTGSLIPYNVDSQDVRQRFWDGHDYNINDTISHLHGNHLFQYGGTYPGSRLSRTQRQRRRYRHVAHLSGRWNQREPGRLHAAQRRRVLERFVLSDHVQRNYRTGEPDPR